MKMIIAIVQDHDTEPVSSALTSLNFRVTLIASTGGFLRRGSSTLLIGIADDQVDQALQVIRDTCAISENPNQKRATIFVLNVARHVQI
jgi:uncharacterized protein YaaQ